MFRSSRSLAQTARFHRQVLYGFAVLLSATIGGATALLVGSSLTRFFDSRENAFVRNQEHAQNEVVRLSSRLLGMVDLYERNWAFHQQENIPLDRYREALIQHDGIVTSGDDLTATPFLLAASPKAIENRQQLSTMLHIVRRISGAPAFDVRRDITVSGFIYAADHSFLAAAPLVPPVDSPPDAKVGAQAFIRSHIDPVEATLGSQSDAQRLAQRPIWLSVNNSAQQRSIAEIVLPIFHDHERVATIVVSIPPDQFLRYFMQSPCPQGFFVLGGDPLQPLGIGRGSARDATLLATLRAHATELRQVTSTRKLIRDGLTFIVAQRVDGPGWIAVYAFDWKDIVGGMLGEIVAAALLCVGALGLLWTGVAYFDRRVAQPFERDAKKLVEAEQFNRSIVDTAPVGIAVFDPGQGAIVLENAVAKHLLGNVEPDANIPFYEAAIRERAKASLSPPDSANQGHTFFEMPWKSGAQESYLGVASSTTRFRGRDAVLFGLVDITERKTTEAMLIEARRTADRANRDKSMFLAIMTHEIRTPLHGATGHLELLANSALNDEQRERVAMIRRSFDALLSLINDLLDATRIEAHALTINPQPIYVNRVVESCAQHFAPTILGRHLALHCYTDPALDHLLEGDDHRLMQILQNLVSNAAKFTQHGSITLATRLLRHEEGRTWVRVEVADTGIGIPSALQAMVFKPLTQADASISRRFGGTGLGLFLCRNLAELMGGTITLQSEPDVGSNFGIEVPLRTLEEPAEVATGPLQGVSVEIATDDSRLNPMWSDRLKRWGATIHSATDTTAPDIRIVSSDSQSLPEHSAGHNVRPLRGTIHVTPLGPYAPSQRDEVMNVSLYSSEALLAALLDLSDKAPLGSPAPTVEHERSTQPLDVLVADDDPVNLVLIEHQLRALGYTSIRSAMDGRAALDRWVEQEADAVVTDLGMPYLDGVGLLDEIRRRNPHAFVVATTAAGSSDITPEAAAKFSHILHKPVLLAHLRDVLAKASAAKYATHDAPRESGNSTARPPNQLDAALREAFAETWPREHESIRQALASRDRDRSRRSLHRLQGALLAMGLDSQAAECLALQTLCVGGDWDQVNARFGKLVAFLNETGLRA